MAKSKKNRRKFLQQGLAIGLGGAAFSLLDACKTNKGESETTKVLSPDGKLIEVKANQVLSSDPKYGNEARKGISNRKFVMVVDLSKCKNAGKCTESCQENHGLSPHQEWMKVLLMKDNNKSAPYWFPKNCYHCDDPPCVKVCPTDATYKRTDGIVLVDTEVCIGCKFCMTACPYSARTFNWDLTSDQKNNDREYSPETGVPHTVGTVGKCDFCPDRSRVGKLPYCVKSCPMGALYFGDEIEDSVSNGDETVSFSQLIKDKAGYRFLEHLGTHPRVHYLPQVDRMFPVERGMKGLSDQKKSLLDDII